MRTDFVARERAILARTEPSEPLKSGAAGAGFNRDNRIPDLGLPSGDSYPVPSQAVRRRYTQERHKGHKCSLGKSRSTPQRTVPAILGHSQTHGVPDPSGRFSTQTNYKLIVKPVTAITESDES